MMRRMVNVLVGLLTVIFAAAALLARLDAQGARPADRADALGASLTSVAPELNARLIALERAQGVLLASLSATNSPVDEAAVLARMQQRLTAGLSASKSDPEAEQGFNVLGPHGRDIVRATHAFHRELVAIYAAAPAAGRKSLIDAAVQRYRTGSGATLPDAPKDMTILYDHKYTSFIPPKPPDTEPQRNLRYPKLTGFMWSSHWYELAVLEALDNPDVAARRDALTTVAERFTKKLSGGVPLDGYPSELPLAPAIAPGLVALHERAASIVDNLNMMLDVITDVLVNAPVGARRAAVDEILAQFTNRQFRCVQDDEWIVVALRHSIFDQGGFALAPMRGYERNAAFGGHGQHFIVNRAPPPCDPE